MARVRIASALLAAVVALGTASAPALGQQGVRPGLAEVHRAGDTGPVIVLIPGLGFERSVFSTFIEEHEDDYRIVAVTLVGLNGEVPPNGADGGVSGGSADDPTPWLDDAEAGLRQLIAAELAEARVEGDAVPAVLVGHSMGGHLAFRLAGADGVAGIVTLDGRPVYQAPGLPDTLSAERRARQVWRVHADSVRRIPERTWLTSYGRTVRDGLNNRARGGSLAAEVRRKSGRALQRGYLELLASDARPSLAAAETPVLVIAGETPNGPTGEAEVLEVWRGLMEGSGGAVDFEFVEGAGHWPLDNRPEPTTRLINNFVSEVTVE